MNFPKHWNKTAYRRYFKESRELSDYTTNKYGIVESKYKSKKKRKKKKY